MSRKFLYVQGFSGVKPIPAETRNEAILNHFNGRFIQNGYITVDFKLDASAAVGIDGRSLLYKRIFEENEPTSKSACGIVEIDLYEFLRRHQKGKMGICFNAHNLSPSSDNHPIVWGYLRGSSRYSYYQLASQADGAKHFYEIVLDVNDDKTTPLVYIDGVLADYQPTYNQLRRISIFGYPGTSSNIGNYLGTDKDSYSLISDMVIWYDGDDETVEPLGPVRIAALPLTKVNEEYFKPVDSNDGTALDILNAEIDVENYRTSAVRSAGLGTLQQLEFDHSEVPEGCELVALGVRMTGKRANGGVPVNITAGPVVDGVLQGRSSDDVQSVGSVVSVAGLAKPGTDIKNTKVGYIEDVSAVTPSDGGEDPGEPEPEPEEV